MPPDRYSLRYLPIAHDDLISILDYIAHDSPARARSFVERLENQIRKLERHPLMGRVPRHPRLGGYGYRVLIVESYLVFYLIKRRTIEVNRVIHGSRNLDHLI